jgi:hypothetical protein
MKFDDKKIWIFGGISLAISAALFYWYYKKKAKPSVSASNVDKTIHDEGFNPAILEKKDNTFVSPNVTASLNNISDEPVGLQKNTVSSDINKPDAYNPFGLVTETTIGDIVITAPCTKWTDNNFPLMKCMKGNDVSQLQKIINKMYASKIGMTVKEDGYFGPQMEMAVKAAFGVSQISYMEFLKIKLKYDSTYY